MIQGIKSTFLRRFRVKEGPSMEFRIEKLGPQGDGVANGQRRTLVYLDRSLPGEFVRANLYVDRQGVSRGDVQEILRASRERVKPPCPHYSDCGGCTLQHVNAAYYRSWKTHIVKEALKKAEVYAKSWLPTVYIGGGNRRRATFSVYKNRGHVTMGYYGRRTKEITEISECLIADPLLLEIKEALKPLLPPMLYDNKAVDIFLQLSEGSVDLLITGEINKGMTTRLKELPFDRICWRSDEEARIEQLYSRRPILKTFDSIQVHLPPDAFLQPTQEGEDALVKAVMAALPEKGKFADLFSGCGTFTGPMLSRGYVDAYESSSGAIKALSNTKAPHLRVFRRDLFKKPLHKDEINRYDAVVFDPPRSGCKDQSHRMAASKCKTLIAVSCNPQAFALDAKTLCRGGYRLQSVQVIDQFLYSHHVELVGVFRKG
jgi:23S rRNA (uracil1939-C5)-methyltransferase